MDYFETDERDLLALMKGLQIIERLNPEKVSNLTLFLYGTTSDPAILSEAKEIIMDYAEDYWDEGGRSTLTEADIELPEIAVSIPVSSDILYGLLGSGIRAAGLEFAYLGEGGEGVRERSFINTSTSRRRISLRLLNKASLADTDTQLSRFLTRSGSRQPMKIKETAKRSEPVAPPPKRDEFQDRLNPDDDEFMRQLRIQGSNSIEGRNSIEGLLEDFLEHR